MTTSAERPEVTIHTDGGCDPNPGPGGWGAVLEHDGQRLELSGREAQTTNNRMELTAAIKALDALKRPCQVRIYTDSQYLRRGITQWIKGWQRNGWRTRSGKPVENQDLWQQLLAQEARHDVSWQWVRGHDGNPLNERADRLATGTRAGHAPQQRVTRQRQEVALPQVALYCQGSCRGNPGPGGYAALVVPQKGAPQMVRGAWPNATNNAMELWAVIAGLRSLKETCRVVIHTTSKYVLTGATRWLADWERNGWRTLRGTPVQNSELWQELANVMGDHDVSWQHASQNEHQQQARRAARAAQRAMSPT